ncbi:hypothetical protein HGRIS_001506 [Hohenbuehelia grisea]|uniref:Cyclin N-terminal domain-containing protein n=1 Tax=Hohenbuehelia grisea TaxID=104357 RepID=A0ABR3JQA5_9AGAR
MIASKVICEHSYRSEAWCIAAQGMYSVKEINQMELEMCRYLDWELTVDDPILSNFEATIKCDFAGDGPYPSYPVNLVSKRATTVAAPVSAPPPHVTTSPIKLKPVKPPCVPLNSSLTADTPSLGWVSLSPTPSSASPPTPNDASRPSRAGRWARSA